MKKYDSPEFELVKIQLLNQLCGSDPSDPVEDNGEEHNFDDGWN